MGPTNYPPPSAVTTDATCSITSGQQLQDFLESDASLFSGSQATNAGTEGVELDFLDSLSFPDVPAYDPALETDYVNFDAFHRNGYPTIKDFSSSLARSHDLGELESGFQGLLDESRISSIIDSMVESPLQDDRSACVTTSHRITCRGSLTHGKTCKCHIMWNKLYLIVTEPKLSQTTKLLPLDLVLFVEQVLQNNVEMMRHCSACESSKLPSVTGMGICIVASWIIETLYVALESELELLGTSTTASNISRGHSEHNNAEPSGPSKEHDPNSCDPTGIPPSMDARNCLRVGTWTLPKELWALCMSAIVARRIERLQRLLMTVMSHGDQVAEAPAGFKGGHGIAQGICARAEILLGMIETWVARYHLRA
ncbi:hypothetical protein CLAFUW4_10281 [Fulvia fulva]|nr:hypothetical protein CLAFUR4_10285 [Fulvia fulva]KAK4616868.1 hypothetical protein CLAFUR0_10283 [Fulvia fulva]WPV18922.1 hypothetical protein CLAFUW4_10281 [Fulvia fulva]WPV34273.1 hypothetical protein CLAFUW7_10281 [Fulvia fulva]